jgi:hypothetical protein
MAIDSLDAGLAGMRPPELFSKAASPTLVAGRPWTPFYAAGIPGPAAAPTPGLAGAALTSYAGQIPFPAAAAGLEAHLARLSAVSSAQPGVLLLCDRLWHNSGLLNNSTAAQNVNSVAWPARDKNGATLGEGVYIGLELSATGGGTSTTPSISYTNSAGVAGKAGALVDAYGASAAAGTFFRFGLAAGDVGVRSVQTETFGGTAPGGGTYHLVAYKVLSMLELPQAGVPNALDLLTSGAPLMQDGTVPFLLFIPQTTTATMLTGTAVMTQA